MALLFADGFEDGLADWTQSGSPVNPAGRNGLCAGCQATGSSITRTIPQSTTLIIGCALYMTNTGFAVGGTEFLNLIGDAGTVWHTCFAMNNSGIIHAYRGPTAGTNVLGTASAPMSFTTWNYLEFRSVLHDTTGAVTVRLNGTTILDVSGVDTRNAGTNGTYDLVKFTAPTSSDVLCDDLYICDGTGTANNTFLGDLVVEHIRPSGNDTSQWVGSDGNSTDNYLLVDEAGAAATADYVGSSIVGNRDLYQTPGSVRSNGTIHGVYADASMAKTDSGAKSAAVCIKEGVAGTPRTGTSQALTTGYLKYGQAYDRKADGSAWTFADLQNLRIGAEVTA